MPKTEARMNLVGEDGNAFSILGRAQQAMRRAKVDKEIIDEYMKEAQSGDYDHLLVTTMNYLICDEGDEEGEY